MDRELRSRARQSRTSTCAHRRPLCGHPIRSHGVLHSSPYGFRRT